MKAQYIEEFKKIIPDVVEFARYVKIQEPGRLSLEYELWPHLVEYFEALRKNRRVIVLKAKQVGISWATALDSLHRIQTKVGSNILFLSRGDREARELLSKASIIFNNLPDWVRLAGTKDPLVVFPNSTEAFGFQHLSSRIRSFPSTEYAGIGETADRVVHDEYAFHDFARTNFSHTAATMADGKDRQMVITSTANKSNPASHFNELFWGAINKTNGFFPLFFPYNAVPDRGEEWYEEQKLVYSSEPGALEQNCPTSFEEALSPVATQSCFNKDRLTDLWNNVIEPEVRQNYIYILHPPRVGVAYAAGVDVGEGVGRDYSSLDIVGKYGLESEVCAKIYTNTLGTDAFAYDVDTLCREYFNPKLAVDNIGIGKAVMDKLIELGYPNLYYSEGKTRKAGWNLTRPNKRDLIVKLVEAINSKGLITRFKPQVKELMEYQWVNGYPEPTGKTHGDTVISLALANEMLKYAGTVWEHKPIETLHFRKQRKIRSRV